MRATMNKAGSLQLETKRELPERVERLRERYVAGLRRGHPKICAERDVLFTQSMKETEGKEMQIRMATALKNVLLNKTVLILPDELIVGCVHSEPIATGIYPELGAPWIASELNSLDRREWDPYDINEETKRIIRKELLPYWEGKSLYDKCMAQIPVHIKKLHEHSILAFDLIIENYLGHRNQSWNYVFSHGFGGIKKLAEEKLAVLDPTDYEESKKIEFMRALVILAEAISIFIRRHADKARELAKDEKDPKRVRELEKIADVCDWISENPPRTFHETLQLFYFTHMLCYVTEKGFGNSPGMLDDALYPYYKKDVEEGRLTRDEALELVECTWLKLSEIVHLTSKTTARYYSGYMPFTVISVGGMKKDGTDLTNDVSYIFLEAMKNLRVHQPLLDAAFHKNSPEEFWTKTAEAIRLGTGLPALVNVEAGIVHNRFLGASLHDARYCTGQGCVYPLLYDGMRCMTDMGLFNYPYVLELALNNGRSRMTGEQISIPTGDPREFKSFDDVWKAFKKQTEYIVQQQIIASIIFLRIHEEELPELYESLVTEGCIDKAERAKSPRGGGTKYPQMVVTPLMGLGDVADSLMAIKKLAFEKGKIAMPELIDALDRNFEGSEKTRQMLIHEAPKFGQDDDEADYMTRQVDDLIAFEHYKYKYPNGSYRYYNSYASTSANVPMGLPVGALPSGRKARTPLSDNSSPAHGVAESKGPTAILRSQVKGLSPEQAGRNLLNLKFNADVLRDEAGLKKFIAMCKTYFDMGGFHVQFNIVGPEVLRDAQKHPEKSPDLLVRVAGYSAYFVSLSKECQDDLIDRATHSL